MKITNRELLEHNAAINQIDPAKLRLRAKPMYRLTRNIRKLDRAMNDYNETRMALLRQHGAVQNGQGFQADEKGEIIFESDEGRKEAVAAIDELLAVETDVDIWTIGLDDLDGQDISMAEMLALEWFVEDSGNGN